MKQKFLDYVDLLTKHHKDPSYPAEQEKRQQAAEKLKRLAEKNAAKFTEGFNSSFFQTGRFKFKRIDLDGPVMKTWESFNPPPRDMKKDLEFMVTEFGLPPKVKEFALFERDDPNTYVLDDLEGTHRFNFRGFVCKSLKVVRLYANAFEKACTVEAIFTHREEHSLNVEMPLSYYHARPLRAGENLKMSRKDAEELIWQCTMLLLAHEVDEKFFRNGEQVRDPHVPQHPGWSDRSLSNNYPDYDFRYNQEFRSNGMIKELQKTNGQLHAEIRELKDKLRAAERERDELARPSRRVRRTG